MDPLQDERLVEARPRQRKAVVSSVHLGAITAGQAAALTDRGLPVTPVPLQENVNTDAHRPSLGQGLFS